MMRDAASFEPLEERLTKPEFWSALPARWTSDIEETLQCCHVREETHDVKSFFFRSPEGRGFTFEPGQFVTLELDIDGQTVNRCYTISSSPTRPHTLSITVKRVPGGTVSNWLHDNLREGARVRVLGPSGAFTCARHPASKYLFLSAGSGITPLMSMSRAHHELSEDRDIVFVHSARTPNDIIFARELDLMAANQRNFRTSYVCERLGTRTDWRCESCWRPPDSIVDATTRKAFPSRPLKRRGRARAGRARSLLIQRSRRTRAVRRVSLSASHEATVRSAAPRHNMYWTPRARPVCGCLLPAPRACAEPARSS
jgi:ferredoxin-NADP reductase